MDLTNESTEIPLHKPRLDEVKKWYDSNEGKQAVQHWFPHTRAGYEGPLPYSDQPRYNGNLPAWDSLHFSDQERFYNSYLNANPTKAEALTQKVALILNDRFQRIRQRGGLDPDMVEVISRGNVLIVSGEGDEDSKKWASDVSVYLTQKGVIFTPTQAEDDLGNMAPAFQIKGRKKS